MADNIQDVAPTSVPRTASLGLPDIQVLPTTQPSIPNLQDKAALGTQVIPKGQALPSDLSVAGELLQKAPNIVEPSMWAAFHQNLAPMASSIGKAIYEDVVYPHQAGYDPTINAKKFIDANGITKQEDVVYLNGAVSPEDAAYREQRVHADRTAAKSFAAHPWIGTGASLADADLLTLAIPIGGEATIGSKLAIRAGIAATYAGAAAGANALLPNQLRTQDERNMDSLTMGLAGAFTPLHFGTKVVADTALATGIATESKLVADEITAQAKATGTLTKANILGEEVHLPISQPLPEGHMIPDMSKDHAVIADIQSSADTMWHLTQGDRTNVLNKVLAASRTQGDNAATLTAATQAVLESKLIGTEQAIDAAARELGGTSPFMWFGRKQHTEWQYNVSRQFGDAMQKLDQQVVQRLNDGVIADTPVIHAMIDATDLPNAIKKIQHIYVDSGFAEEALSRAKHGGLLDHLDDVAALHSRPSYVPVKHSWEQMHALVQSGRVTEHQLHKFLGNQIIRMYPEMQEAKLLHGVAGGTTTVPRAVTLSAEDLGKNFYETLKERALGLSNVTTAGITREQMVTLLRKAGVVDKDIENIANKVYHGTQQEGSGAAKNLRSRLAWDWTQSAVGKDGNTFSLGDLVDGNAFLNLSDYARTMSHRVGLAKYGIKTEADFNTLGEKLLQNLPAGVPLEKAREFLKNVKARSFGHTVGENLPAWVRSGQTLAGSMFLAGSGLYNIGDLATQVAKMGLLRTLPELRAGMKNIINPMKAMAANEAKDLQDILTGVLSADGRWRNIQLRYADNFEIGNNAHNAIQYMGQSTKFMNGSEYVKRFQTGIIGGIFATAFKNAAKGSAKDIKYMKETLRISDDLTDAIIGEYKTHGAAIDLWDNSVRYSMEQKVFAEADNLALTIRNGEIPAFMEHSAVGKVLFPFMSFTMSTQNKVLRNTYARDGGAGVAMIAAVQLPTAILIAMSKNVIQGKEPDDKLARGATNALSITGAFGYPLGIALDGGLKTSSTPLAPVSSVLSLGQKMYKGDAGAMDYLKASPFGAAIGLQGFITAMESAH